MSPRLALLLSLVFPAAAPAQTFVVDAANGPGTNFTDLLTASTTVPDGATLLVRPGHYASLVADAKGEIYVDWQTRTDDGRSFRSGERLRPSDSGSYRLRVAAGQVQLRVQRADASGSLDAWSESVRCPEGRRIRVDAVLPRGATVVIRRPKDLVGEWFVRTSLRRSSDEDWRGSWTYGTDKDSLRLTALRPAEWRFEFRQLQSEQEPTSVRVRRVLAGDDVVIHR